MRSTPKFISKVAVLTLAITIAYYFAIIKPNQIKIFKIKETKKILSTNYANLVQNRIAFTELTRLDPNAINFDSQKSDLVATLTRSNEEGLKALDASFNNQNIAEIVKEDYPELIEKTKTFYKDQKDLLEKVFATKSYQEGVEILKSDEAIKLLTDQTNLILNFDFQIRRLEKELERINSI